jgi:hypothetical protein
VNDIEARLEAAIKSGNVSDELLAEARAEMAKRGIKEPAPELLTQGEEGDAAGQKAHEEDQANRRAALDAGEADTMFEAKRTGKVEGGGLHAKLMAMGGAPELGARFALRTDPRYIQARADAGDEGAKIQASANRGEAAARGIVTSMATGNALGPARGLFSALGKGGLAAATGTAAESAAEGDDVATTAKRAGSAASAGGILNMLFHVPGSLASRGQQAIRRNPDTGRDIRTAEEGGYKTSFTKGLKPKQPTGREPGRVGVEEEAADLAPKAMTRAEGMNDALKAAHDAADEAYFASEAGRKTVDSTPIIQAFKKLIDARAFNNGEPIPESAWARLVKDAEAFSKTIRVPIEHADEVAAKTGGVVFRRQLGPTSGEPAAIPVTPGGRAVTPGNPPAPTGGPIPMGPAARPMPGPDTAMVKATPPGQVGGTRPMPGKPPTPVTPDGYTPPGGAAAGDDAKYATVLVPRQLDARELEAVRNTFDSVGNAANRTTEDTAPMMEIANTARGMRKGFPGLDEMRTSQSSEVSRIKNLRKALGIPESRRLNTEDLAELKSVGDALERYKAPGNLEGDRVIEDFLAKNPEFRDQFKKLAGMSAAERVRTGGGKAGIPTKGGALDWMLRNTVRLDPAFAALAKAKGGNAALAGQAGREAADLDFLKQFITQRLQQQEAQP